MPDDGLFILSTGDIAVTAGGDVLQTVDEKCQECGCGEAAGPCCATQDCTIVLNAQGNWVYTAESAFDIGISVASAPWRTGAGNSPAYSGTLKATTRRTVTRIGGNWCSATESQSFNFAKSYQPYLNDSGGVVTSHSGTASLPWANPFAPPYYGVDHVGMSVSPIRLGVNSVSATVPGVAMIAGASESEPPICSATVDFNIGGMYDERTLNNNKESRAPASCILEIHVYRDGGYAVWDLGGYYQSGSVVVVPEWNGQCVVGFVATLTLVMDFSSSSIPTTYTGTFGMRWTAGLSGCGGASPATSPEACNSMTYRGTNLPYPPEPMPEGVAQRIVELALGF